MQRKIMAVTGGRADWSLLVPPLQLINKSRQFELCLVATGQHLSSVGEASLSAIEEDGFTLSENLAILDELDTSRSITHALARAVSGMGDIIEKHKPDLLFILGDRYEILGVVQAAVLARLPIAHLCGGDVTYGAIDDVIRHAITKMSHLHFVTNEVAAKRVCQMGEDANRIFNVGSTGVDRLLGIELLSKERLFDSLEFSPRERNILVTYHPETLSGDNESQCAELLSALDKLGSGVGIIFTGVNADVGGRNVRNLIQEFSGSHENALYVETLGAKRYASALSCVDAVVGNSSSGLYEAPSFKVPTVNIGNRQAGRLRASSVIDSAPKSDLIFAAIRKAFSMDCSAVTNPYGEGNAAEKILSVLEDSDNWDGLVKKKFRDRECSFD